ncbi:MAG: hypothetical protein AB7K09_02525 [Planctomycetota bacterium]
MTETAFPCPRCGAERVSEFADCPDCDYTVVEGDVSSHAPEPPELPEVTVPVPPQLASPARGAAPRAPHADTPCHCCGGKQFEWGSLRGHGLWATRLERDSSGLLGWLFGTGRLVRTRECVNCGNVQLFTRPDDAN